MTVLVEHFSECSRFIFATSRLLWLAGSLYRTSDILLQRLARPSMRQQDFDLSLKRSPFSLPDSCFNWLSFISDHSPNVALKNLHWQKNVIELYSNAACFYQISAVVRSHFLTHLKANPICLANIYFRFCRNKKENCIK